MMLKVLSYHRVLPLENIEREVSQRSLIVTAESFRKQMIYLKKKYEMTTLEKFIEASGPSGSLGKTSCIVTFDDGWRDNYLYAFPILNELSIPATIFVAANHIETGEEFWPERLTRILLAMDDQEYGSIEILKEIFPDSHCFPLENSREEILDLSNLMIIRLKSHSLNAIAAVLSQLEKFCSVRESLEQKERTICSWEELKEMSKTGLITIGSHTKSHALLSKETIDVCNDEIFGSKEIIERKLGIPVKHFSYPNGDFNSKTEDLVRTAGYETACTCLNGTNNLRTSTYRIRRIHINESYGKFRRKYSNLRFATKISSGWQKLEELKNSVRTNFY